MEVSLQKKPKVRISYDEMEAYLLLPTPIVEDAYALNDILELLKFNGVKFGIFLLNLRKSPTNPLENVSAWKLHKGVRKVIAKRCEIC